MTAEDPLRGHHRPLPFRRRHLVLADVSARPAGARARGLLHRGHRRVRLRPGAEHALDRSVLRHRPTSTRRSSRSGSATDGRSSTTTAPITASSADDVRGSAPTPISSSTCRAARGSGATSTRASRASAFIDSDPAFTQLAIAKAEPWYVEFFKRFDHLFTFGSNIGTPASPVPVGDFTWHKTWQPVTLDHWAPTRRPGDRFTTVMTWQIESFTDVGGNKDQEFVKFIDLPSRTPQPFELAINGPQTLLREHGWATVDAMGVSRSRGTIASSSSDRRRSSASPSTPTWPRDRAGSAIARNATWRRPAGAGAGHRLDRRTCPPARGCSPFRARTRRSRASTGSTATIPRHARRAPRSPRNTSPRGRVLTGLLETTCSR